MSIAALVLAVIAVLMTGFMTIKKIIVG